MTVVLFRVPWVLPKGPLRGNPSLSAPAEPFITKGFVLQGYPGFSQRDPFGGIPVSPPLQSPSLRRALSFRGTLGSPKGTPSGESQSLRPMASMHDDR